MLKVSGDKLPLQQENVDIKIDQFSIDSRCQAHFVLFAVYDNRSCVVVHMETILHESQCQEQGAFDGYGKEQFISSKKSVTPYHILGDS